MATLTAGREGGREWEGVGEVWVYTNFKTPSNIQHNSTTPEEEENQLPQVGLEPTTSAECP